MIGSQSSGKSSVLEHVVGRDFLPRGTGIVTRRPLVLQLYHTPVSGDADEAKKTSEWGEFLHLPGQKFFDFDEIRNEISRETERVTGRNRGISNKSISLKIHSPSVLNLTLVDLPGMTKVSVGDQPADIEDQIRAMCLQYIKNPNAIVLAVTAANTDLANSDALKLAREADPECERTIGVLTKLDLMDPGTDAVDVLQNRVIPLRRGYVGVTNRGQRDIDNGVSIREALVKEQQFFKSHPGYRNVLQRCSTPTLSRVLNGILMHHIRVCLPEIKNRITSMSIEIGAEIEALGQPTDSMQGARLGGILLTLLSNYTNNFTSAIEGKGLNAVGVDKESELYGGARISYIFTEIFGQSLYSLSPFDGLNDDDIRTAICNANGPRPSLFVPEIRRASAPLVAAAAAARSHARAIYRALSPSIRASRSRAVSICSCGGRSRGSSSPGCSASTSSSTSCNAWRCSAKRRSSRGSPSCATASSTWSTACSDRASARPSR